jgi:hypothetical protein
MDLIRAEYPVISGLDKMLASALLRMLDTAQGEALSSARLHGAHPTPPLPPPSMSMVDAEHELQRQLLDEDLVAEGRATDGARFERIPASDWRSASVRPERGHFNLCHTESGAVLFHDVWIHSARAVTVVGRGTLPRSAKAADRKHEEAAHDAADLVRGGMEVSQAISHAAQRVPAGNRTEASVQKATRRSFDLMYNKDGTPLQNS